MSRLIEARQNETWDIIAYRELGYEHFAKDIMLLNPSLSDIAIFDGGEAVLVPDDSDYSDEEAEEA